MIRKDDLFQASPDLPPSLYTVASKRWLPGHIPSLINVTIVICVGAFILLPFCLGLSTVLPLPLTMEPVWALGGLVIGSTAIAYVCWTQAIARIGVTEPNLFFNFTPIVTMVLSSLHGVPPNSLQMVGALMVLVGVTGSKTSLDLWKILIAFHSIKATIYFYFDLQLFPQLYPALNVVCKIDFGYLVKENQNILLFGLFLNA